MDLANASMVTEPGTPLSWIRDIIYATRPGRALLADLVRPAGRRIVPVIIWLHGGGFRLGSRKLAPDLARYFARAGFAMLSIDYRLSQEAPFPAALEDALAAIGWVVAEGAALGLDARRIGLWGSSAGGYLAAMLASTGGRAMYGGIGAARIGAAVIGYPPVDFIALAGLHASRAGMEQQSSETGAAPTLSREAAFLGGEPALLPERTKLASPLTHITGAEPPCLILHGAEDRLIPPAQSEALFESLAAAGACAEYVLLENLAHAFLVDAELGAATPRRLQRRHAAYGHACIPQPGSAILSHLIGDFFFHHLLAA